LNLDSVELVEERPSQGHAPVSQNRSKGDMEKVTTGKPWTDVLELDSE
jgi:hypothetical protein